MSFGFSVSDIIEISKLGRRVWRDFRDSPAQFNAIQSELVGLCFALENIDEKSLSGIEKSEKQATDLSKVVKGCRDVVNDTEQYIKKNESLVTESSGLGSKTQKTLRRLRWDPSTVDQLRARMAANTVYLNTWCINRSDQVTQATHHQVEAIAENLQSLRLSQSQQERDNILHWVSQLNFAPQQSDLSARRQEGTGSWLIESPEFHEWENKAGSTLVCQGIPGAGKTMLTSLVIDHLQQKPGEGNSAIAYIYCDYRRYDEQSLINLIANITKQILGQQVAIPEEVVKIYQYHRSRSSRPTFNEVLEMTNSSMSQSSRIYLVLDALDELNGSNRVREDLLEYLCKLQNIHRFSLMTTSRYIHSLDQELHSHLRVDIRARPEDIRRYVQGHIPRLAKCVKKNPDLQEIIANTMVNVVDGMFLLAQLHMDSLKDKTSAKLIKQALQDLPNGSDALDRAYDEAMQRIENQMKGLQLLAKQLLGWLTYSERLMTVEEVLHALAIEPGKPYLDEDNLSDKDDLVSVCAGLVIIDEETQIIRLVHYTTQDFFRKNGNRILSSAQQEIATSCLTYLLYKQFEDGWVTEANAEADALQMVNAGRDLNPWSLNYVPKFKLRKYPFLEYAAKYWVSHARPSSQPEVKELVLSFAKDDLKVSSASQVIMALDPDFDDSIFRAFDTLSSSAVSAMHLLAYFGHADWISELLDYGFEADVKDSCNCTPLWWAALQGHHAVVELLLSQKHVDVNNVSTFPEGFSNRHYRTPLKAAVYQNKDNVVELLVKREDVDVNLQDNTGLLPLHVAVRIMSSTVIALLLTREDIQVNSKGYDGLTPLHRAVAYAQKDITRQLLKREDMQVNSTDGNGLSPLAVASKSISEATAETLLNRVDIDVNSKDNQGRTPLTHAMIHGQSATVRLLCAHPDVDLNPTDIEGRDIFALAKEDHEMFSKEVEMMKEKGKEPKGWRLKRIGDLEERLSILRAAIAARLRDQPTDSLPESS